MAVLTLTGNTTSGSNTVTGVTSLANVAAGQPIAGAGIPSGATIASASGTSIVLSANATATASAVALSITVAGKTLLTGTLTQDALGNLLTGTLEIIPTDENDLVGINPTLGGAGGQVTNLQPAVVTVTAGVIPPNTLVPDTSVTQPINQCFRFTFKDEDGYDAKILTLVQPSGPTLNLDTYVAVDTPLPMQVPGPAGASAYQIAVADGFSGSVSAWLASLEATNGFALAVPVIQAVKPATANLLDPTAIRTNVFVNASDGSITANTGTWATPDIPVASVESIVFNLQNSTGIGVFGYAWLDGNGNVLSSAAMATGATPGAATTLSVPTGAMFFRCSIVTGITGIYVGVGTTLPSPTPFFYRTEDPAQTAVSGQLAALETIQPAGANLLDTSKVTANSFVQMSSGAIVSNTGTWASGDIAVAPGQVLVTNVPANGNHSFAYAFLDARGNVLTAPYVPGSGVTITVPAFAAKFRISLFSLTNAYVGVASSLPSPIPPFLPLFDPTTVNADIAALQSAVPALNTVNLADPSQFVYNSYLAIDNGIVTGGYAGILTTGYIPVTAGVSYQQNFATNGLPGGIGGAWYDQSRNYISGQAQIAAGASFTAPTGAYYYRTSYTMGETPNGGVSPHSLMVVAGTLPTGAVASAPLSNGAVTPFYLPSSRTARNNGKRLVSLGDSITEEGEWQALVCAQLGMTLTANFGSSGVGIEYFNYAIANVSGYAAAFAAAIAECDIFSIFLGTNDFTGTDPGYEGSGGSAGSGESVGTTSDASGLNSVCGQLLYILNYALAANPNLQPIVITPYFSERRPAASLLAVCQAEVAVAQLFGAPVVPLYQLLPWNSNNWSTMLIDNLHPSPLGFQRMAAVIAGQFEALL